LVAMDPTSADLASLLAERQLLHAALGREVADRPWPAVGEVVTVGAVWDGPALYGQADFLALRPGDRVRVAERHAEGWLRGTVESTGRSGWMGGIGCTAVHTLTVSVPLGPVEPDSAILPDLAPGSPPEDGPAPLPALPYTSFGLDFVPEVQEYVSRHGIDEAALQALKELPPDDQRQVIDAELVNVRNPSAVLLSRIRQLARSRAEPSRSGGLAAAPVAATQSLVSMLGTPMLGAVAAAGAGASQQDPARSRSRSPQRGGGAGSDPAVAQEVEDYVRRHSVDEAAAQSMRLLPPDLAREVMMSDLNNCRNPSAVLMKRIRTVEQGRAAGGVQQQHAALAAASQSQPLAASVLGSATALASMVAGVPGAGVGDPGAAFLPFVQASPLLATQLPIQQLVQGYAQSPVEASQTLPMLATQLPIQHLVQGSAQSPVEEFIQRHNLDDLAKHALRELPAEYQKAVIEAELVNCRNPSAVVQSRIQTYRAAAAQAGGGGAGYSLTPTGAACDAHGAAVEEYIARFSLDERVAQDLRLLRPDAQKQVIETELVNARNPSAVVTSRIQAARMREAQQVPLVG